MDNTREKFSGIYDQYIDKIYRFVYLKVNSQDIAEDLTSKVFLKGWEAFNKAENVENKQGIINPGAFLYQIARNTVIDHYRDKAKVKMVSTDTAPQLIDPGTNIEQKAILSSDMERVKTAIQGLKKDYQDIVIWHYLDDMPVNEIAETLRKPAGTVRVMLSRGLKALKKELEGEVKQV